MLRFQRIENRSSSKLNPSDLPHIIASSPHQYFDLDPMNVCMIAYTFYEGDNRVMRYAETLAARGDSVDIISLAHQGQQRVEILSSGVRVIRIQSRIKNERTKGAYLFRIMQFLVRALFVTSAQHLKSPYDFVHVHSVPDFLVFAAVLPRLTGAKIVLDIHDLLPELYGSKFASQERSRVFALMKLIERVSSAFVDHVIAPNHIWQERLIGRSVPREKCSVFMNYPDPAVFRKQGRSRNDNRLVMIYPGTLNWHQGVDIAIRAFVMVASRIPHSEFHIYGEGPSKLDLARLTHELGLNGKVLFFDSVGLREIAGKIENADLGVVPKRNDPFGDEAFSTKTLEFMMLGVPLIVADTTVDRRYFNDDVVTFFKAGDTCSLGERMLRLFEDANLRSNQATRARIFVEDYSWETRKKEYLSLINHLVGVTGALGTSHPTVASRMEGGLYDKE